MTTKTILDHDLSGEAAHNVQDLAAPRGWPTGAADALRRQDLADHVDGSTITWDAGTGQMSSSGGTGGGGIASWDITKCRYIFVDPINGSDANGGYIDAVPGTDFTGVDLSAISVQTTHRINEIRPICGNGRMCVVLIAEKSIGGTPIVLDHATALDGLGMEDRRLCFGYQLLHTRGSDLTNSVADRSQLGFVTDATLAGPGATGEWTVYSVTSKSFGVSIVLTGAVLSAGGDLTRYRLRCQHSGGAFFYLAPRWSAVDSDDPDAVVVWITANGLAPGDSVWIETEGVLLNSFHEAASYASDETSTAPTSFIAGIRLSGTSGQAVVGCADDPRTPTNCTGFQVDGGFSGVGSLVSAVQYTDEVGVVRGLYLGPGLSAPTGQFDGYVCDLTGASIGGGPTTNIRAARISAYLATFQDILFFSGEQMLSCSNCNYGQVTITPATEATFAGCRGITSWSPHVTVQPLFGSAFTCLQLGDLHNLRIDWEGSEPAAPAVTLKAGHYGVLFDHGSGTEMVPGNGVRIEYDSAGTKFTPLSWYSLQTTGFEIEGLQKVLCKMTGTQYKEDMLPCPRGRVMRLPDSQPT